MRRRTTQRSLPLKKRAAQIGVAGAQRFHILDGEALGSVAYG
jgi:hypothetical protein